MVADRGEDYGRHRAGFPASFFERLASHGIGGAGQRVLDLGTGMGSLGRGLAARGCEVVGLDRSEALIEEARKLDLEQGLRIDYVVAPAERNGLDAKSFDVVTAGQSWGWFDRGKTLREVKRVLRPGGRFAIAHFDALPLQRNAVEATEKLLMTYAPTWAHGDGSGLHPEWLVDVRGAGFTAVESFSYDAEVPYSHESWRARVASTVRGVLAPHEVARFDENLRRILAEDFADEPLRIPHCVWALVCQWQA